MTSFRPSSSPNTKVEGTDTPFRNWSRTARMFSDTHDLLQTLSPDNEVAVRPLVTIGGYRDTTSEDGMSTLLNLASRVKKIRILFISATPR
ncbi:hypothetical protein M1555_03830 [Patescibacteria group bacterium]|nr:hypothetical protein [Patescibacteria group bacterium]